MFCSGKLFWIYATTNPEEAKLVLTSVQPGDSLYDALWKGIANHTYLSSGEVFVHFDMPILSNPGDLELHRENAQKRLESEPLDDETKYILQAIISGGKISLSDGSVME